MFNYKIDIGAFQKHPPGKDKTKETKPNIGADSGDSGKPIDTLVQGRRRGSYSTGPSVSNRKIVL